MYLPHFCAAFFARRICGDSADANPLLNIRMKRLTRHPLFSLPGLICCSFPDFFIRQKLALFIIMDIDGKGKTFLASFICLPLFEHYFYMVF